jgi:hypothetical protein
MCSQTSCPFNIDNECTHPAYPVPEDCDILPLLPEEIAPEPPLYAKFSFTEEWRHIPSDEVYPIWTDFDLVMSAQVFRERHQSKGPVMVFSTSDLIDWKILGQMTEDSFILESK